MCLHAWFTSDKSLRNSHCADIVEEEEEDKEELLLLLLFNNRVIKIIIWEPNINQGFKICASLM